MNIRMKWFRVRKSVLSREREREIFTYIIDVFEPGGWCFEISWIGQSICSDRAEIRQREMVIVHLQYVSSDGIWISIIYAFLIPKI